MNLFLGALVFFVALNSLWLTYLTMVKLNQGLLRFNKAPLTIRSPMQKIA